MRCITRPFSTWRLWLSYDGSLYNGYQSQRVQGQTHLNSVQDAVTTAISRVQKRGREAERVHVIAAGRTDAGVHAHAMKKLLPPSIAVLRAENMSDRYGFDGFHARFHAIGKRYVYRIWVGQVPSPFTANYSWNVHVPSGAVDETVHTWNDLFGAFVGENVDFESFRCGDCQSKHAIRTIWQASVSRNAAEPNIIEFDLRGNAFVHNQVRIMIGTVIGLQMGQLKRYRGAPPSRDMVHDILQRRCRREAGKTAPARGLSLDRVYYPDTVVGDDGAGGTHDANIPTGLTWPRFPPTEDSWPPLRSTQTTKHV